VIGDQDSGVFSTGTYGFMISYNDVGEGGFTLPDRVFFCHSVPRICSAVHVLPVFAVNWVIGCFLTIRWNSNFCSFD
jgi:hypothetical protein